MRIPEPTTVDFETKGIQRRPHYPPKPVSVTIVEPGKKGKFLAWGHPSGNNCSEADGKRAVAAVFREGRESGDGVCFHNGKFDTDVALVHWGLRLPEQHVHDTMFLAFLANPDRTKLNLAQVAEEELRVKAWKEGKLKEWILKNCKPEKPSEWGAYIADAPAGLVMPRGIGDATNTSRLFSKLYKAVAKRGMLEAYRREQRVMPCLLESERRGIRVNLSRMERELPFYEHLLERADQLIRRRLRAPDLDVDKREQMADALEKARMITQWQVSASGKRLTNKKVIQATIKDKGFIALLAYRSALATSIRTFFRPWILQARETNGYIHTTWNQVRSDYHGDPGGARTGRVSSSPNWQNIPIYTRSVLILPKLMDAGWFAKLMDAETRSKFPWAWEREFTVEMADKSRKTFRHACPLPMMKGFVLPYEKDHVLIERDYSQQEFRILAHYEDGELLARYKANPRIDVHDAARDLIAQMTGTVLDRRPVKDVGFSLIYGMGNDELARKIEKDVEEARKLKAMYMGAMPGLKQLQNGIKLKVAANEPIITWGGRQYFCEPPSYSKKFKRWMTYEYKLINRLIQGSAADCTKEGTARHYELPESKRHGALFLMTVHDSTVDSVPKRAWKEADQVLRKCMESVEFDVPMLTDGKVGFRNLGELVKIKDVN